jgi:hypothetical protein
MDEECWAKCQYYAAENCPDEFRILLDRAYLIPHLLDYSEIETAKKICRDCKIQERRNSYRLNRPLTVVLTNKQPNTKVEGTVINSSASGALVKLRESTNFANGEVVEIEFTSNDNNTPGQSSSIVTGRSGVIKRQLKERRQVAVIFLSSAEQD